MADPPRLPLLSSPASIIGVTGLVGPTLLTQIFAKIIDGRGFRLQGAPCVLSAALVAVALAVVRRVKRSQPAGNTPSNVADTP